ncbi:NCS1 family nucleobase:cation symporter-1 [Mycolicibacterium smegmatis]|uniref:Cytosine/uracil/thiamine/allantoin permease n=3 Tax=Mycolicibacterium smegmatis TaxID=1772 RepID=I7FML3_MYCS2|nr:NCS1 family nucleobase:cation symporter-1 [Mycolicibacterium smegmatis]ABK74201.1 integral membrane transporter [Mycolicibacterium smegmatis MC2 155]AFP39938.1 Putative cytosine/uracil/thiamine/allantoin permease [Mycolicibacterium smegmatis MC2 155]AIU08694.1 nitrate reductase [Mycolicibacterium smegmatis MC2 155]AIU15319.1 nitrate reductase [Mycolicibacterium smegmatis]AIU21942.1 nitrate reductase [Mycolicibacterium smegmatis]
MASPIALDAHGHTLEPSLYNEDLRPIHPHMRTWTSRVYLTLWVAMCMNPATWTLAASLIALGMNWIQALLTIVLANLIVLIPMLLNSHAGAKHGISFPVFARAAYGVRGANLPAVMRGLVACGWFGIQTWFGGLGLNLALGAAIGPSWSQAEPVDLGFIGTVPITTLVCYAICLVVQVAVIYKGFESLRRFQAIAAPIVVGTVMILIVVLLFKTGGNLGPVVSQPSHLGWGAHFWLAVFPISLMANIAFWSTLSLNMPDFTRFAENMKAQRRGQSWGLPTTMLVVSLMAIIATSLAAQHYGVPAGDLWNPDVLVSHFGSRIAVFVGALAIVVSSVQTNMAANLVSPALDFANALPKLITFRRGVVVSVALGTLLLPWKLLASPETYVFVWLGFYGGIMGAVGGVLVSDYWLARKTELRVPELFTLEGHYHFTRGWNVRAVIATAVGAFVAVGGAYSALGPDGKKTGPFPADGVVPLLRPLYDYNWVVAFLVAMFVYWLLAAHRRKRHSTVPFDAAPEPATVRS